MRNQQVLLEASASGSACRPARAVVHPSVVHHETSSQAESQSTRKHSGGVILSWAARLSPWGLIAGLAYTAVFIKATVDAAPLQQPIVEQRDMFFGAAGDKASLWVVGQDGAVLHGVDGATRWSREVLPGRRNLQAVAVSPNGVVVTVGNHGDLWLKTPGQDWRNTPLPVSEVGGKLLDVAFIGGHFWVAGEMGALFRSGPGAGTWERVGEEQDVAFNTIRQGVGNDLWIAAEFGRLLRSRDGGASWTTQELGIESLRSVSFEGQIGVAVGNAGHVYVSQDGGDSWKNISRFTSDHLRDVVVVDGLWSVVGDNGTYFQSRKPAGGWVSTALEFGELGKGYFTRILPVAGGNLLVGQQLAVIDSGQLTVVSAGGQP